MKRRGMEEQIIAILKEHEAGTKTAELAASTGSARRASITGRPSTAGSRSRRPSG